MSQVSTLLLLLLVGLAAGQESFNTCPRRQHVRNFQLNPFLGLWYLHAAKGIPEGIDCRHDYLYHIGDGRIQGFIQANWTRTPGSKKQIFLGQGLATPIKKCEGRFKIAMDPMPHERIFDFIDVEYNHYAILLSHATKEMGEQSKDDEILLVVTRKPMPNIQVLRERLTGLGFNHTKLNMINQENCLKPVEPCLDETKDGLLRRCLPPVPSFRQGEPTLPVIEKMTTKS